ncbi:MAG TPA: hypothetical protein VGM93_07770 [Acidimicrobiales bacterium]
MSEPAPFAGRSVAELATLVREYLLCGHLIDRAGMPHLIGAFGLETMRDIAIDEWMGASPVYSRRMQRALRFEGDAVETIFKGMQLDIGAPPQFMDFRYRLVDHDHGEFWLDHCGALMDVEPMGEEFVVAMCHDIEDPTFDATAAASNPRAQVRPIHRPPRSPADRHPHCHWTVTIDAEAPAVAYPAPAEAVGRSHAAGVALADPVPTEAGRSDYAGPLLDDLRFEDWSPSALARIAEEVCLQWHLLVLSFLGAVRERTDADHAVALARQQFTGIAGLAAERLHAALGLGTDLEAVATVLELHPAFLPRAYVDRSIDHGERLTVRFGGADTSPAVADGAWPALLDADHLEPLDAIIQAIDPTLRGQARRADGPGLVVEILTGGRPTPESDEVALTRFSTGARFAFGDRGTPVEVRPR